MKPIKTRKTQRGFALGEFTDHNGQKCSIQISSAMGNEAYLWLGCAELNLSIGMPWRSVSEKEIAEKFGATNFGGIVDNPAINANTRMHLSQSQVKQLLPLLKKFAKTGSLE